MRLAALAASILLAAPFLAPAPQSFQFVILGDRTGGAVPGVYEEALREAEAARPAFVVTVGDTIEGGDDLTIDAEWRKFLPILGQYPKTPFYLTPGNHDVWSPASARAFQRYARHPLHYGFDYQQAHFCVLDNSRKEDFAPAELSWLSADLEQHKSQPVKFVFSHRPSWIVHALLSNPQFPFHQIVKKYGVRFVVAGHIHQMLRFDLDGIEYVSLASSGGRLRGSKAYRDGWFFQHAMVAVDGTSVDFLIRELGPPFGQGRQTTLSDWGTSGLRQ
jgi:hypothetical protein